MRDQYLIDGGKIVKWNAGFLHSGRNPSYRPAVDRVGDDIHIIDPDEYGRVIDKSDVYAHKQLEISSNNLAKQVGRINLSALFYHDTEAEEYR